MPHIVSSFSYPIKKQELIDKIEVIVAREGITKSELILKLFEEYNKVHGHGNPQHSMVSYQENESFDGLPAFGIDFDKKKSYTKKYLQKEGKLNKLGKEAWGHAIQWYEELKRY